MQSCSFQKGFYRVLIKHQGRTCFLLQKAYKDYGHMICLRSHNWWKDWCWSWSSNTWATWCEEPTHWKRPWCWERLRAGKEGGNRGWDSWIASLTQRTWVWANSGRQCRTGKPDVLQSMGLQSWTWLSNWTTAPNKEILYAQIQGAENKKPPFDKKNAKPPWKEAYIQGWEESVATQNIYF